jgi:hypothetical protein
MNGIFAPVLEGLDRLNAFSASLFWEIAKSPLVLAVLALLAVAAFLVAHAPVIERLVPAIVPFTKSALVVQLVASALLMFLLGFGFADQRAETERLKNELAWTHFQLDAQEASAAEAQRLRAEAEARADQAKGQLDDYENKFGGHRTGHVCPPAAGYLEWLHALQRHRPGGSARGQPRGLVARLRAVGGERR